MKEAGDCVNRTVGPNTRPPLSIFNRIGQKRPANHGDQTNEERANGSDREEQSNLVVGGIEHPHARDAHHNEAQQIGSHFPQSRGDEGSGNDANKLPP